MRKSILLCILFMVFPWQTVYAQDKVPLRVGYVPLLSQLPLIVSYDNGRLNFQRLEREVVKFTSFTSLEAALRVGAIDAASIPVPIALSIAADAHECESCQITVIGSMHKGGSLLVTTTQGGAETIRGKLIGVPGLDSTENLLLNKIFTAFDLRLGLDYKTIEVPFGTAINQLKAGKLQGLFLPEPFGTMAEKEKIAFAVDRQQHWFTETLTTVMVIRLEFLKANITAAEEWVTSIVNSCRFIENDVNTAGGRQTAIIQMPYFGYPEEIVVDSLSQRKGDLRFGYFFPHEQELQEYMQLASEMKLLMKSVDWSMLISKESKVPKVNGKE